MKKQILKNKNGITLIALVVTIVVLLILAGTSISMLTGENGIIKQAQQSKENNKKSEIEEKVKLAAQAALMDELGEEIKKNKFQEELDLNFGEGEATLEYDRTTKIYTVTVDDYEVEVSNTGAVGEIKTAIISLKLILSHTEQVPKVEGNVKELTNENVPIPTGYYYVGGTKDTGVVISDVEGDDLDNTAQGNQFVWVPVNQNQKLTLEVESQEEITGIVVTYPDGTTEEITANGTSLNQEITMTKNGVYAVEVLTEADTKKIQKRITSLYAQDVEMSAIFDLENKKNNGYNFSTIEEFENEYGGTIEDVATANGMTVSEVIYDFYFMGLIINELEDEYKEAARIYIGSNYIDNNQNIESVNKYGGYYISRYEAGDGTTDVPRTTDTADTNTLVSKKGAYVYNIIDAETSKTLASGLKGSNTSVTSQLITGAGWDRTLNWIIETGEKTEDEVIIDSRSWGNYNNSTGNAAINSGYANVDYTTGRSEYWKANNIYDLAGNTKEWTQEIYNTYSIFRGGDFSGFGNIWKVMARSDISIRYS